jgi:predicted nucleic acid-binding protein
MALVVDASIAVGWIARTQATPLTLAALTFVAQESGHVPSYFAIEVARALRSQERRNLLAAEVADLGLAQLRGLPLTHDNINTLERISEIVALARRHDIRIADAAYLELAIRTGFPLATRDQSLMRAAQAIGVALFKS